MLELEGILTADQGNSDDGVAEEADGESPPASKCPRLLCPRLLSRYKALKKRTSSSNQETTSIPSQISKYFDKIQTADSDALVFWEENKAKFPQMSKLAMKALSVPASSAPVERVFSVGGIIMRPHRSRLRSTMLNSLVFLKCNHALI